MKKKCHLISYILLIFLGITMAYPLLWLLPDSRRKYRGEFPAQNLSAPGQAVRRRIKPEPVQKSKIISESISYCVFLFPRLYVKGVDGGSTGFSFEFDK